eukprot:g8404.t1
MIGLKRIVPAVVAAAAVFGAAVNESHAQAPTITSTSPQAAKPGSTVDVTIRGANLAGATQMWTSFAAKTELASNVKNNGKSATQVVFRVTVPKDIAAGIHGVRVATPNGVSAMKLFVVDDLPTVAQQAGNTLPAKAQVVKVPVAIDGTVAALTRNYYRFQAQAGQTLSFEALARRIGSPLDPMISIFAVTDSGPTELKYSDDALGLIGDSQFSYKFTKSGDYLIEIRDIRYQGSANHRYRLRIGDFPCVTAAYPMGVERGSQATVAFAGSDVADVVPVKLTIPKSKYSEAIAVAAKRKGGSSSGFAIVSLSVPQELESLEQEPNNETKQATAIKLGANINGRFQTPGDVDRFAFTAKKGQRYTFAAVTRSQGSPTDLVVRLENDKGAKLAEAEDSGMRDGALTYTFPADGKYILAVEDLHRRGGMPYVYRVKVTASGARFQLSAKADHVNVPAGGTTGIEVKSTRSGYNGPISLKVEGLPAGITSVPTVIGPGRNNVILTLTGTPAAKRGVLSNVRIVGTGQSGKTVITASADISAALTASSSGLLWPPKSLTSSFAVGVAAPATVAVQTAPSAVSIAKGKTAKVKVTIKRGSGVTEAVTLALTPVPKKNTEQAGLPKGLTVAAATIPKGKNEVEIVITAAKNAPKGVFTATLAGTVSRQSQQNFLFALTETAERVRLSNHNDTLMRWWRTGADMWRLGRATTSDRRQRMRSPFCTMALLIATSALAILPGETAVAYDDTVTIGKPTSLEILPSRVVLQGRRSQQQLVISGDYAGKEFRDLTSVAAYTSSNPAVAVVKNAIVHPVSDGSSTITVKVAGKQATVDVLVKGMKQPSPVSFQNGMLAALSKAGCNSGACHGSPSGKAGFRLSLRAFDPTIDLTTLRQEFFGRRTNIMKPEDSLLLKKPLMEVAHGGGRRLKKGEPAHIVMRDWIAEGLRVDTGTAPTIQRLELLPNKRVLQEASKRQQLVAMGHFSDGSVRDVTALTVFTSSNESVATVTENGLVEKTGRGESAILARYLEGMATSHVTFLENVKGFVWNNPKPHNFVDTIAFAKLKQLQILPSDLCTDSEFIRRAYLDTTGRLPTAKESLAFLDDKSPNKRDKLVDRLVQTPEFASFWTMKWSDILRSNSKKLKAAGVYKFRRWIYDSIRSDKPVDQFARELITARGSVYENPAANYWRASRDPNDATETTAQLFLGIRIQCAKCHNHPFERWSQDNYYGIAAAFTRIGRKKGASPDDEVIFVKSSGEIKQPRTGKTMKVHLLLKGDVDDKPGVDRREVFANWLTSPKNPFFARASVNRIWGHLMGRGIVEPVDDFRDSNPPSNEKLLDELAQQFAKNNFSRKWAVKTIMKSRLYQLSSRKNEFNAEDEIYSSHATTRLLGAEQLLDAICQVTGVPENFKGLPSGTRAVDLADPPTNHYFLKIFGQPQREMACQCERSNESNLSQALQMINGPVVHNKLRDAKSRIATMIAAKKSDVEIITSLTPAVAVAGKTDDNSDYSKGARIVRTSRSGKPRNWALLVGVTNYQHLPNLRFCARDMTKLGSVLTEAGGYEKENVRIVADIKAEQSKSKAGRDAIRRQWESLLSEVGENDTVLFAFSGHGMQSDRKGYLMSSDADPKNLDDTAVAMSWVYAKLDQCPARSKVVMVDACHSGATKGRSLNHHKLVGGQGVYGLFSCEENQESWEDPAVQHGVFTYYLIAALRGEADMRQNNGNGDKQVSADEVFQFLSARVPKHVKTHFKADQKPFRRVSGTGLQVLSRYKEIPVPEDTALMTLPGLRGEWWFSSTPWLLPLVRGKLSNAIKRKSGIDSETRTWTEPDVAAMEATLKSAFAESARSGFEGTLPANILLQLQNWKGSALQDAEKQSMLDALKATGDLHSLAVVQHYFGIPEAGENYKQAIAAFQKAGTGSPGRFALCRTDYGRWLASSGLHFEACAQYQLARELVSDRRATPLFHIDCWCVEADSHRRLGEWKEAEACLKTAVEVAKLIDPAHPIAVHIHRRFAWMYMDQWRLNDASRHFKEANRIGVLPAKGDLSKLDYRARINIHHNHHGLAMCSRYSGDTDDAIKRYRNLQRAVAAELNEATDPLERAALISRLVNTMERLADCYLFSAKPDSRRAADMYRRSYRLSGDLKAGKVSTTRAKLICRRAIALALNPDTHQDSLAEIESLKSFELTPGNLKSLSLYKQVAEAIAAARQKNSSDAGKSLRDVLTKAILGADRKKFSRDEFDLLFLASNELIVSDTRSGDSGRSPLAADVERIFDLIPSDFRRPEVLRYQRGYYDNAIGAWLKQVAPKRMVDLTDYIAIAKTGKPFRFLGGADVIMLYYPLDQKAPGYAVVYSAEGKHTVAKLKESRSTIEKAIGDGKSPVVPSLDFPKEISALLKTGNAELHWRDTVLALNSDRFPYRYDGTLKFVGEAQLTGEFIIEHTSEQGGLMSRRLITGMLFLGFSIAAWGCGESTPETAGVSDARDDLKTTPATAKSAQPAIAEPKTTAAASKPAKKAPAGKPSIQKYALLVGCTKYDGAPPLQGPINDVKVMSNLLATRFQFPKENVRKLVGWPDTKRDRPTYANIVAEFDQLIDRATPNSQIVILLSGHGSQVPVSAKQKSLLDPANREPDGMDEVFLPSDFKAWDHGTVRNSLSDNQLSGWLNKMSDKGASVWLICDCCHSGTLSKAGGGPPADVRWRRADPSKHLGIPAEVMRAAEQRIGESGSSKSPSLEAAPVQVTRVNPASKGRVVAFYAAQPFEEAPEMPRPRGAPNKNGSAVHGMLTYSLARVLEQNSFPMTYRELSQKVLSVYRGENLSFLPTPSCDGDVDHEVLGLQNWPGRSDFLIERHGSKQFVTGGELHGLNNGTILRVRPPAGSGDASKIIGFVRITSAGVTLSEVTGCEFEEDGRKFPVVNVDKLPELARCEVVYRATGIAPLKLAISGKSAQRPTLGEILKEMPAPARAFIQAADLNDATWVLKPTTTGYDLVSVQGKDANDVNNRVVQSYKTGDKKTFAKWLADDLRRITLWQSIWNVAEAGSITAKPGAKKPRFRFDVKRIGKTGTSAAADRQNQAIVHPKDILEISLDNRRGFEDVWVTVLFLDARYGIDVFLSESIGEGKALKPIQIEITDESFGPEGLIVLVQNLKEFGQRQRFEFLSQKQLGTRGESKGVANPQTPFEKLLATARGDKGQNAKGFPPGHPANPIVFTYSWVTRPRNK